MDLMSYVSDIIHVAQFNIYRELHPFLEMITISGMIQ